MSNRYYYHGTFRVDFANAAFNVRTTHGVGHNKHYLGARIRDPHFRCGLAKRLTPTKRHQCQTDSAMILVINKMLTKTIAVNHRIPHIRSKSEDTLESASVYFSFLLWLDP